MEISVWAVLAFALWTIIILFLGVGVHRWSLILTGRAEIKSFVADEPQGTPFYRRAMRAHANCVENLPLFLAIVFAAQMSGTKSGPFDTLAIAVVGVRVLQSVTHLASGSNRAVALRFIFFVMQIAAFVWMSVIVINRAMA